MNKYNCLIIGAGGQGARADAPGSGNEHKIISFAHAFKEHEGFDLLRIEDKNVNKAWEAMDVWHCVACYHKPIDVVIIATSDDDHYQPLLDAMVFNPRLVIVEKPLCTDLAQAREIVELYKAKDIGLMVNYTRRFLPYYEDLKRRYEAGEFGELINWSINFNRGWLHTGSHAVDFINWLVGYPVEGINKVDITDYRVWQIDLFFAKFHWREERIGDQPVWDYYDRAMWHIVDNAYQYLEGKEPLKCTGEQALRSLEICFELMAKSN